MDGRGSMQTSGAGIIKSNLEKYVLINLLKTQKNKYEDRELARLGLTVASHIVGEMSLLNLSNKGNDFGYIKKFLRRQITFMHREIKNNRSFITNIFKKSELPPDFNKCINQAWVQLHLFEKQSG
jgi:hypothetical protein